MYLLFETDGASLKPIRYSNKSEVGEEMRRFKSKAEIDSFLRRYVTKKGVRFLVVDEEMLNATGKLCATLIIAQVTREELEDLRKERDNLLQERETIFLAIAEFKERIKELEGALAEALEHANAAKGES